MYMWQKRRRAHEQLDAGINWFCAQTIWREVCFVNICGEYVRVVNMEYDDLLILPFGLPGKLTKSRMTAFAFRDHFIGTL